MRSPSSWLLSASSLALVASTAHGAENNPDSSVGKTLYITSPACDSYKCVVTWARGDHVTVNWLEPAKGDVSVSLVSNVGGPTYPIVKSMPGTTNDCDAGAGPGKPVKGASCGSVRFIIPSGWVNSDNNTIMVQSLSNPSDTGYTDAISIKGEAE